jgi:hypothetical protein
MGLECVWDNGSWETWKLAFSNPKPSLTNFLPLHRFQHLPEPIQSPWKWGSTVPWHSAERKKLIPQCKHTGWQPSFGHDTPNATVTVISNRCNYLYVQCEKFVGSQAVATLQSSGMWHHVVWYRCFRGTFCLKLQGTSFLLNTSRHLTKCTTSSHPEVTNLVVLLQRTSNYKPSSVYIFRCNHT